MQRVHEEICGENLQWEVSDGKGAASVSTGHHHCTKALLTYACQCNPVPTTAQHQCSCDLDKLLVDVLNLSPCAKHSVLVHGTTGQQ